MIAFLRFTKTFKDVNCFTAALRKFEKALTPKTSSTIINQLLGRQKNTRPHSTLNLLPATADAPNTAPQPRKPRGRAFDVFICLFGSIARGHLNNRQQVTIPTKIQNPKPKTAQPQYDRSS
ncbi:hypothetical protein Q5692_38710 [Microcoleus sp. C2C3]|uniref:hypothetical protein n=1 Tax=unclassified Microcoleus TaxID=2642155 RepID=UPI002FCF0276